MVRLPSLAVAAPSALPTALLTALLVAPSLAAQSRLLWTYPGTGGGDNLGYDVAPAGDIDRDGRPDVIAGAPFDDDNATNAGTATILSASGRVLFVLRGLAPNDEFGTSVMGVGDVNRDGWPDVIVGAPGHDHNGLANCGSAEVFSGRTGNVLYAIYGLAAGDEAGYAVGAAGDIDRDGYADFIVGMHLADAPRADTGIARVYSGRDGHVIYSWTGELEGDHFGAWVGEVGDVNADGWPDICVTAPWADIGFLKSGSAYVFSGRDGSRLWRFTGEGAGHEFGTSFAKCGDIDGDGFADLWISEPEHKRFGDDSGSARLISGRTGVLLEQFFGAAAYEYFGLTLGAGDFDGDGKTDLIASAFLEDTGRPNGGAVFVYSGVDYRRIFATYGSTSAQQLGRGVTFVGDMNGDGLGDLAAGAPGYFGAGADSGGVLAFCGAPAAAATSTFGIGCPAARPFRLSYGGTPRPGQAFSIVLQDGPITVSQAWLVFAVREQAPLDLTAAGMTACTLYQPLDVLVPVSLSAGAATVPLSIPTSAVACGLRISNQAIGWQPGANPLGVITSNGGRILATQ